MWALGPLPRPGFRNIARADTRYRPSYGRGLTASIGEGPCGHKQNRRQESRSPGGGSPVQLRVTHPRCHAAGLTSPPAPGVPPSTGAGDGAPPSAFPVRSAAGRPSTVRALTHCSSAWRSPWRGTSLGQRRGSIRRGGGSMRRGDDAMGRDAIPRPGMRSGRPAAGSHRLGMRPHRPRMRPDRPRMRP